MNEIWKTIDGFNDYEISNFGRVRSLKNYKSNYIIKPTTNIYGYHVVTLHSDKKKQFRLHRLVAENFISNKENKPQVNHIDGDKTNNHVDNLEWVTAKENINHAWDNNLCYSPKGTEMYNSILTDESVRNIRKDYSEGGVTQLELSKQYGVSRQLIGKVVRNEVWLHVK